MSFTSTFKENDLLPWQAVAFCLAIFTYACFGSPTPDKPGLAEITVAFLLVVSISLPALKTIPASVMILAGYGLSIPLLTGAVMGHPTAYILRDVIAFAFLLLPVFYSTLFQGRLPLLILMVCFTGLAFSVRTLIPYGVDLFQPGLWLGQPPRDTLYLANSPEVLFTALLLSGYGAYMLWSGRSVPMGLCFLALAVLPVVAMTVMMQRAGLGCVVIAACLWGTTAFWLRPLRMAVLGACLCIPVVLMLPLMGIIFEELIAKTEMVGLNSRTREWDAVLGQISGSVWTLLAGAGWGATFENPAVANLPVNFTHSLLSSLLWKTGLLGCLLSGVYFWDLARGGLNAFGRYFILVLSLAAPLIVAVILYASYKSLGFGLLLLVLHLMVTQRKLEKNQGSMS